MKSLIASLAAAVLAASIMSVSIFAPVASATVKPKPPGIGSTIKVAAIPGASGAYSVTVLQVYSNYIYDRAPYRLTENGQIFAKVETSHSVIVSLDAPIGNGRTSRSA